VTVRALDDGFYIADDGIGIPADEHDVVFEAGRSAAPEGAGFGLKIVQEITGAHGWNVRITESDISGARFEITGIDRLE
jgi:signal transduction histidine kinase